MLGIAAGSTRASARFLGTVLALILAMAQLPASGWSSASHKGALLTLDEARQYMVELINRDRRSQGLAPVALDLTASRAAQAHSEEMAQWGYISHWDMQGRKPDHRYAEAGGRGAVFENVYTNHNNPFLGYRSPLAQRQLFPRGEVEAAEAWFFNQLPPRDGHRRNLLDPNHKLVGIGLSLSIDKNFGTRITCAQEFVHQPGQFGELPGELAPGETARISGRLEKGVGVHAVQVCYEPLPKPLTPRELKRTTHYSIPTNSVADYFPAPLVSPAPVHVSETGSGQEFSLTIKPGQKWRDGLYYVIVWVRGAESDKPFIASTRIVRLSTAGRLGPIAESGETPGKS